VDDSANTRDRAIGDAEPNGVQTFAAHSSELKIHGQVPEVSRDTVTRGNWTFNADYSRRDPRCTRYPRPG
jgi:hypothetical protein